MDILLLGSLLALDLAGVAVLDRAMGLGGEPQHEDSFPAELSGCCDPGMTKELVSGLNDPAAESVRDVQAATLNPILGDDYTPQLRSGVLLEG